MHMMECHEGRKGEDALVHTTPWMSLKMLRRPQCGEMYVPFIPPLPARASNIAGSKAAALLWGLRGATVSLSPLLRSWVP